MNSTGGVPKAFLSYSHDSEEHRAWVLDFAARLRNDGVEAILDQWEVAPGDQIPEFMERAVRENDFVLIICTPRYRARSDGRLGGVGYEGDIMTAEVMLDRNQRKFIPILRSHDWRTAAPSWLAGRKHVDLRGHPPSEREYADLLATIHGTRPKPPPVKARRPQNRQTPNSDVSLTECITEQQSNRLKELVNKAAEIEITAGMEANRAYQKWWTQLGNHYGVASYHDIPHTLGDQAIKWLEQRVAMLRPKLRRTNPSAWRAEHFAAIWARARELEMSKGDVYSLVRNRLQLQVVSLKQLGEKNLKRLYSIIMSLDGKPGQ